MVIDQFVYVALHLISTQVPPCPTYIYVIYYLFIIIGPVIAMYFTYLFVDEPEQYLINTLGIIFGTVIVGWFIGAVFYNLCKIPV